MNDPAEHPYRFSVHLPVRWRDVDAHNVVNHAVYATFIEQARFEYFTKLGLMRTRELFPFVLLGMQAQYHLPGRAGMQLEVSVATVRLGRSSFEMLSRIRSGDTLLVTAKATGVYVDDDVRSVPIPEEHRRRIEEFEGW